MPFDEDIAPDVQEVLDTSALLEITEFEVFRIAHRRWFGSPVADREIEPFFADYMFSYVVPFWVRHFTHEVMRLSHEGAVDPRQFGIRPRPVSDKQALKGLWYLLIVVAWVALLLALADLAVPEWLGRGCFLPPCY